MRVQAAPHRIRGDAEVGQHLRREGFVDLPQGDVVEAQPVALQQPGDVLLVEGQSRFGQVIRTLTQSTWSHAAIYVGPLDALRDDSGRARELIEADVSEGVRALPLAAYAGLNTRICRPRGMSDAETQSLIDQLVSRIGHRYDLRNVLDLARYLLPTLPIPRRWRRQWLELGSGDPSRAICSTLIAGAFQSVRYPILPTFEQRPSSDPGCIDCVEELARRRHHSLFVPRDFDLSPYFDVVKPQLSQGFDPHAIRWLEV